MSARVVSGVAVCLMLVFASPVLADDAKVKAKLDTPLTRLNTATDAMMKGLDENQLRQFVSIEKAHGIIRAVDNVQQSISRAVTSCSKANPDMKAVMTERFVTWKDALRPVMKQSRNKLDKMVLLQSFAQPSEVRAYLKKFDDAVVYRNQGIKSIPVTEKDACEKLRTSMDKTQSDTVNLITETLELNAPLKTK